MDCNTINRSLINLSFALSDANKTCLSANSDTSNSSSGEFRELIEAIYKIQSIIRHNKNLDDAYDRNIAINRAFNEYFACGQ